ncbi:hypothetical protein CC78DRAFT_576327 [Lojkania enalia]|uniref:Uncharacterized protein n=1 Tax=Lojkania enalia TaxID=147567 RepID=A0A9P4N722_9PLEO|nr:hypothetical protein CC78DRAFT_576327 [Didymosphaeria enalia]
MSGIFLDAALTNYSSEYVSYLQTLSQAIHSSAFLNDGYIGKENAFISALGVLCGFAAARSRWSPNRWAPHIIPPFLFRSHSIVVLLLEEPEIVALDLGIHNPGALPEAQHFGDPNFAKAANLTVVFEEILRIGPTVMTQSWKPLGNMTMNRLH